MFWIAIFGSSQTPEDDIWYQQAYQLGRQLAIQGWTILNGGYGGIMEAVSKGATDEGGTTIGITTLWLRHRIPNPYLSRTMEEPTYLRRLERLLLTADGYVFFPGGSGTFLELTALAALYDRGWIYDRPIVLIGSSWKTICSTLRSQKLLFLPTQCTFHCPTADNVVSILSTALNSPPTSTP